MYNVWLGYPSNICFINMCIYLLKLIHIKQAYSTLSTERYPLNQYIATLLNYKHFCWGPVRGALCT